MSVPIEVLPPGTDHTDKPLWLANRTLGITATDIAAIVGVHPYRSAWEVYQDKVGNSIEDDAGEAAEWGTYLEPHLVSRWQERYDGKSTLRVGLLRHPEMPWMLATPDRLTLRTLPGEKAVEAHRPGDLAAWWDDVDGILEAKTALGWMANSWDDDTVPDQHLFQVLWQLAVTGLDHAWVIALTGPKLRVYQVDRDDELIEGLIDVGRTFLERHVLARVPPPPDATDKMAKRLAKRWTPDPTKTAYMDRDEFLRLQADIDAAVRVKKDAEARELAAKNRIRVAMGDATALMVGAGETAEVVATWKPTPASTYTTTRKASRTLRFPTKKEK